MFCLWFNTLLMWCISMLGPSLASFPHPRIPPVEKMLKTQTQGPDCIKIFEN